MVAFALRADGWYLRQDIIWHKPNAMPDTAQDRPTSVYEHVFLLTKSARYFYNASEAVEPAANGGMKKSRNVWSINTKPSGYGHFATFPVELAERCIREGSQPGDLVLDPFAGAGTVGVAAQNTGRDAVLIELRPEYAAIIEKRLAANAPNNAQEKEIA
jgi:DNA modification methylase